VPQNLDGQCACFAQHRGRIAEPGTVNSELIVGRSLIARSSVRTHLGLAFGVLVMIAAGVTGYAILAVDHLHTAQLRTSGEAVPYLTNLSDASLAAKSAANDERGFLLSGTAKFAEEAQGRRTVESGALDAARRYSSTTAERAAVDEINAHLDRFNQALDAEFQLYRTDPGAAVALSNGANRDLRKAYEAAFTEAVTLAKVDVTASSATSNREASRAQNILLLLLGLVLLCGVIVAVLLSRLITRPLARSVLVLESAAAGDLTGRVRGSGAREFQRMATATNTMLASTGQAIATIAVTAQTLSASAGQITTLSGKLTASAETAAQRAATVSAAAGQASASVQTVAAAGEEMSATIREISSSATSAAGVASTAVASAEAARATVLKLTTSSTEISSVIKLITAIAEQTNLLALNATIEAARAGDHGKGFAVVAGEVKDLAQETARATGNISRQVATIQSDTVAAMAAIDEIGEVIAKINDYQTTIAGAVEEQAATTNEMGRSAGEASGSTTTIADNITSVAEAAEQTCTHSHEAGQVAVALSHSGADLTNLVAAFKY
jgi:methyl-accepting chemotaxis protein